MRRRALARTITLLLGLLCLLTACSGRTKADIEPDETISTADDIQAAPDSAEVQTDTEFTLHVAPQKQVTLYEADGITWEIPDAGNKGTGGLVLPLATDGETLSVFRPFRTFDHSISSPGEVKSNQLIAEKTGVSIDWQLYSTAEQFNLMVVSRDYADMIWGSSNSYTGGVDKAVEDEVYINAFDYFELTPNYVRLLESDPEIQKRAATDGHNYFFTAINSGAQGSFMGPQLRRDWLDDLGLDMPSTYDEWYAMLSKFRDEKGASDALFLSTQTAADQTMTSGYGTFPGFYAENGTTVRYGYIDDAMFEYVSMVAKWYREGLLYRDFMTNTDMMKIGEMYASNASGAASNAYYGLQFMLQGMMEDGAQLEAAPLPRQSATEEKLHFRGPYNEIVTDTNIYLTTAAVKRGVAELAAQWIDYRYSEEGSRINYYGIEGKTWEISEDGYAHIIPEPWQTNTIDDVTYEDLGSAWADSATVYGGFIWIIRICDQNTVEQLAPIATWNTSADTDWHMPNVTLTTEEGETYRSLYGDIETYVLENIAKFVIGERSLDEWDGYVADVKNMGIQTCVDCYQAALDRFNTR